MEIKYNYARVFAPATIANVGPGFDIFGVAVNSPGDEVEVSVTGQPGIRIVEITGDQNLLPKEAERNTATVSMLSLMNELDLDKGLDVKIHKKMPIGSGMGSSAASSVAGVCALNALLSESLGKDILLNHALEGEKISSGGAIHLDNIAACLYGGFILVHSKEPADIIELPVPDNLKCVVIHPQIEIKTSESRKLLKKDTSLSSAVIQWGNIAGMVAALYRNDLSLLSRSLIDVIAEPVRSILIPEYDKMKSKALELGAIGFNISGSGPSVFAFCDSDEKAQIIGTSLQEILNERQIRNDLYITEINKNGPKVLTVK
jgi:homoserine kinase